MIGHHARFRENDDLPLWQGPAQPRPQGLLLDDFKMADRRSIRHFEIVEEKALGTRLGPATRKSRHFVARAR